MCQAHDGGVAELDAYRELIVPLKKRSVNDVEYVAAVVQPVFVRELCRYNFKLLGKADARLNTETRLDRGYDRASVFAVHLPWLKRARVFPCTRVRYVENITQTWRIAAVVHERDALGSATHIASHASRPHVVLGTRARVRPLCVDKHLVSEVVFVVAGHRGKQRRPLRVVVCRTGQRVITKRSDAG